MLQAVVRWLVPRDDVFFDLLERHVGLAERAATALDEFRGPETSVGSLREQLERIEAKANDEVHAMEDALARTMVTPLDREDLQRLSNELDLVVDFTCGVGTACDLLGVAEPTEPMQFLATRLARCTQILAGAVARLRRDEYRALVGTTRDVRAIENEAKLIFREAVSSLFHDPYVDVKRILREREVLEDLEKAIQHCERTAATPTNVAVKHG